MNKKIIRRIWCLIVITSTILFPSLVSFKTTSAITLTQDVTYTNKYFDTKNGGILCEDTSGQKENTNQNAGCSIFTSIDDSIMAFTTNGTLSVKRGYYYEMSFYTFSREIFKPINWNVIVPDGWILAHYDLDYTSDSSDFCVRFVPFSGSNIDRGFSCSMASGVNSANWYLQKWTLILTPISDGDLRYGMGIRNDPALHQLFIFPAGGYIRFGDIYELAPNSDIDRAEQETQEATDEGEQNSNQADSDNTAASQNLLQTAGNIISAFSAPATNCSLNADLGHVNLGSMNFCQDKPHAVVGVIDAAASILVAFAVYRIIRSLINRFVSLTTYGQGGSDG